MNQGSHSVAQGGGGLASRAWLRCCSSESAAAAASASGLPGRTCSMVPKMAALLNDAGPFSSTEQTQAAVDV